jgi:autotransporter translocation and assembly factor TamB
LTVNGTALEPLVAGEFTLTNGRVRVATKTFRIQDGGKVNVAYRPSDITPRISLDIEATTRVTSYSTLDQTRQTYVVTVSIGGSLDNPTIDFRSDPPDLSRTQILAALGYQSQIQAILQGGSGGDRAFRQGIAEAFTGVVTPALFEPLEFAVMRALGLEDFAISYDFNSPLQVQFTKNLFGKFYVTYRQQLAGKGGDYMLKLYYRLTRRINLSYSTDERNVQTWAVEGRLQF